MKLTKSKKTAHRDGWSCERLSSCLALAAMFVTFGLTNSAVAQQKQDPMLTAMQAELDREKSLLILPGMQRPYFMEYRLDEQTSYEAVANYGALTREETSHQRVVRVTVRIGSYQADSSSSRGDGSVQLAPEDNDPAALRYALWTATDEAYKNALRAYSTKQAALKRFQSAPTADDFAPAKPVTTIEPLVTLDLDRNEWKRRLVEASGLYAKEPSASHVQFSTANLRGIAVNRYLLNTEGTVVRHGYTGYNATISVGGQAPDGMQLARANGTTAALAKDLESGAAFHQRTLDDLKSFEELRNAPVVGAEDYHGPVLFSGDAAADTLSRLFIPNIEADRPDVGTTARTQGAYSSSLRTPVLSALLDVKDDPLLTTFAGQKLLGSYDVDDEGVPAQSIDIVQAGKLMNFVIGREPVKDFPDSNGHGRAGPGQPAHSRAAVTIFKSTQPVSAAQLNQQLVDLAKKQGRDVYAVETLGGELVPRLLYVVHADGKRELVRGATFDELDARSLRSGIVAVGSDAYVSNILGAIPQTTIAPSILFGDIEVKRATDEQQKLPYYEPPALNPKEGR
ncbi:metallopeptidase TldD-related protein [Granulicella arctica]|uniref:metallopeptidase TldD-related protein n=1 Tax=Granulicella arctica TaxID=940613 RepID=UPI0021DFE2F6|nr:metallopeptidase TldD-related protein [Granulicella arctica]